MASENANVVSLRSDRSRPAGKGLGGDGAAPDAVGALLGRLLERCKPGLMATVQTLFDHADDALFELADKAGSNAEQNMYFESMREVRIRRRGIELALGRDLQENFRRFATGQPIGVRATPVEQPAGQLTLIEHEELEELVAIDSMVAKAEKEFANPLAQLNARLQTLLPSLTVNSRNHPFAPANLCGSFLDATRDIALDIKARLVLFKLFDRHVVGGFGALYQQAERFLADEGVEPQRLGGRRRASVTAGVDEEAVFSGLQQLLEQVRQPQTPAGGMPRSGLVAPGLAPVLPRDALMQLLAEVQRQQLTLLAEQQAQVMRGAAPRQLDVLNALSALLSERLPEQPVSIGQVDDDAINLVSLLFQFVLDDRNLAAPIKALIARLQIPILKVAMADKSFFSKGGHPARKLLNEMANASLGWVPAGDPERDALYLRIRQVVDTIIEQVDRDETVFHSALADFNAFVELERRRAALVEQRTIDAEDGRARSELARATVEQTLSERIGDRDVPVVVRRLLDEGWSNVMFLVALKEGTESTSWQQALETVDDLLASVAPVESLADRSQLLRRLPGLLKSLRSGLTKVGTNPFLLNEMFTELEQLHLQRLRNDEVAELVERPAAKPSLDDILDARTQATSLPQPAAMVAEPAVAEIPVTSTSDLTPAETALESGEQPYAARMADSTTSLADLDEALAAHFDEALPVLDDAQPVLEETPERREEAPVAERSAAEVLSDAGRRVDQLQVGGWVELVQPEQRVLRCRLAAIIRATGKYIFVNRAGIKVAENTRDGIAELLAAGQLTILDDGRLFDRALESVIGNLREMRGRV